MRAYFLQFTADRDPSPFAVYSDVTDAPPTDPCVGDIWVRPDMTSLVWFGDKWNYAGKALKIGDSPKQAEAFIRTLLQKEVTE